MGRRFLFCLGIAVILLLPFNRSQTQLGQTSRPKEVIPSKEPQFAPLTIERVFGTDHQLPPEAKAEDIRTVLVTGDVIPGRGVNIEALRRGFTYPWLEVADFLKNNGDLRVVDLEAPLLKSCPVLGEGFTFCGDYRNIEGFKLARIDMVSLENNHITNFSMPGVRETILYLEQNDMAWGRRDAMGVKEVRGLKFGLLAYNGIGERIDREQMVAQIKESKPQVDILMVMYHWGKEYERLPKSDGSIAPDDPQEIAHLAVDAGGDLVLGNHPHWVMATEFYKDHFIPYGHGNFIFDQMWSDETRLGVVGKYTFYKTKLVDVQFYPTKIFNYSQPRLLQGAEAAEVLDKMKQGSQELAQLDR